MPKLELLKKYSTLAVKVGANVNKDQAVLISAPVIAYEFVRLIVEDCYLAGAKEVLVNWNDSPVSRLSYLHATTETLKEFPEFAEKRIQYWMDKQVCRIHIDATYPGLMADIDPKKIQEVSLAMNSQPIMTKYREFSMNNTTQWTIVAYPTAPWAKKVFNDIADESVAIEKLWDAIFSACRVGLDNNPVQEWRDHMDRLAKNNKKLNDFNFKSLHFKNSLGTDLEVGLVANHIWSGGEELAKNGIHFAPNMPTEETFTMPHKYHVNGKVYSTKPLNFQGRLIEDFYLVFKDGEVIDFDAKKEKETLKNLINTDEGAKRLGEVALISHNSPISNTNILFLNTLFDENASCHLALGNSYPNNIKDGSSLSAEDADKVGSNRSKTHNDFMFGSADMEITGTKQDGTKIQIFKNGNFII